MLSIFALFALAGCSDPGGLSPTEMNSAYEKILEITEPSAVQYLPGSEAEKFALDRVESYFAAMTSESVATHTAQVYAPEAWLYDNLGIIEGADAIEAYFLQSAADTSALAVDFLQLSSDGPDYFVRWRMTMAVDALQDGEPLVSYGMTQFRFDEQGRILVHRDFWDAGTGVYEYLPVIGGLVRRVRGQLSGDH